VSRRGIRGWQKSIVHHPARTEAATPAGIRKTPSIKLCSNAKTGFISLQNLNGFRNIKSDITFGEGNTREYPSLGFFVSTQPGHSIRYRNGTSRSSLHMQVRQVPLRQEFGKRMPDNKAASSKLSPEAAVHCQPEGCTLICLSLTSSIFTSLEHIKKPQHQ
jgi:hypothetical protein